MLELGAHETISFAGVAQDEEVNTEHGHIEYDWDQDEAYCASREMPDEEFRCHADVAEEIPELFESAQTDGGDGEEANPLAAHDCAEGHAGER